MRIVGTDAQPASNIEVRADADPADSVRARYALQVGVDVSGEDAGHKIVLPVVLPSRSERGIDGKDAGALRVRRTIHGDGFDRRIRPRPPPNCGFRRHA